MKNSLPLSKKYYKRYQIKVMRKSVLIIGIIAISAIIAAAPVAEGAEWNPLKDLKEEAKRKAKEAAEKLKQQGENAVGGVLNGTTGGAVRNGDNKDGVGRIVGNGSTDDATSGLSYRRNKNTNPDGSRRATKPDPIIVPERFRGVKVGNTHTAYEDVLGLYEKFIPKETASTVHLVLEELPELFSDFHDGVAYVRPDHEKAFYINERGEKLFESNYKGVSSDKDDCPKFYGGVVMECPGGSILDKGKVTLRDKSGNTIKEFDAKECSNFVNGVAMVAVNSTPGKMNNSVTVKHVDTKGNFIFPNLDTKAKSYQVRELDKLMRAESEGLIAFPSINDDGALWGFRDERGNIVIKPKYAAVGDFHDGAAMFYSHEAKRWGFIDKSGREIIPASFTKQPSDFDSGLARVETKDRQAYIIDKNGKKVKGPFGWPDDFKDGDLCSITPFHNGYAVMGIVSKIDTDGRTQIMYCTVDPRFNVCAWTDREINSENLLDDGNGLYLDWPGWVAKLDIKSLDLQTEKLPGELVNGYIIYDGNYGKGFLNENLEFVIKFEENEF